MGFALSILYLLTYYLTPTTIFGPLAQFRVELILALLIVIVSVPALSGSYVGKTPQCYALLGLAFATVLSVTFGVGWIGGGLPAFLLFIPNAFAYFLVCLHCNTKMRLQIVVAMLVFVCLFVIAHGAIELRDEPAFRGPGLNITAESSYQLGMPVGTSMLYRLRGMGEINDPNDFSQVVICVIPLVFIFWRPKSHFRNLLLVLVPVGVLTWGVYLTHSRGALLALIAMVLVALRRRIGTVPALIVAGLIFGGASALHFTGGRDISADAGQDRLDLWSAGMELLKAHPLFGVGLNRMPEYAGLTAHNSVVVCAAELGFFGLFFWSMFLFPTLRDVVNLASPAKLTEPNAFGERPAYPEAHNFEPDEPLPEPLDKVEIGRMGQLVLLSLTGFLVTGWFLSRAFVVTLFLLGGIVEVIYQMAFTRGMIAPRWQLVRVLRYAGGLAVSLIVLMYIMLRLGNLMR